MSMSTVPFWWLTHPQVEQCKAEWVEGEVEFEQVTCASQPDHMRPGKRIGDLSVKLTSHEVPDVVWTWYSECLVQERVLNLLRQNSVTGYTTRQATVRFKHPAKKRVPFLWELVVTGWGGLAPPDSGVSLLEYDRCCGRMVYSDATNPSVLRPTEQWDGSDIFMMWPYPRYILAVDRVAKLLMDNKVSGILPTSFSERRRSDLGTLMPGRLSNWFSADRVREIGRPLGIE